MSTPDPTPSVPTAIIVPPEGGRTLHAFGDSPCVKLAGEQTGGTMTVVLNHTPPGGGPPPHLHRNEDETFLVLEGKIRFLANGEWTEALPVGSVVYLPRGTVHTFQNIGDTPSRAWIIATPSGFENFFARCAAHFATPEMPPNMAAILGISSEHGIEYVPPLAPGEAPAPVHV